MSFKLRLTEEDWQQLTPSQIQQVRHLANSGSDGRKKARRYIAALTQPETLKAIEEERERLSLAKKLRPFASGFPLKVSEYAAITRQLPTVAGSHLAALAAQGFITRNGSINDPHKTFAIAGKGLKALEVAS